MAVGKRWTRDELLVALNLYHKLTFGQMDQHTKVIIELAKKLGRTPSSLAMKLTNLASLDPALQLRGIEGLKGASNLDKSMWQEFHENLNEAAPASEEAMRKLVGAGEADALEVVPSKGFQIRKWPLDDITEKTALVRQRRGQDYFRNAVVNNFGGKCGVTQLALRELLIASHILPWGSHPTERLNVRNGLCLSRLHDAAFDQGLIAFDEDLRMLLSPTLNAALPQKTVAENFGAYAGEPLGLPTDSALPEAAFLAEHRAKIFRKK